MESNGKKIRLSPDIAEFLKRKITETEPTARIFLFGSRTDLNAKGGDIDIMVISENPIPWSKLAPVRRAFFTAFGWQKLDIVVIKSDDISPFYRLISPTAIPL